MDADPGMVCMVVPYIQCQGRDKVRKTMTDDERKEMLFKTAKNYAKVIGTDTLTRIILEECGEWTDERREQMQKYHESLEGLIRKSVKMALSLED
jgi:hypothetical protein